MGCLCPKLFGSTPVPEEKEEPKQYSWDHRDKVNPKDFMIENLTGQTVCRLPNFVKGQQFIIQNCQDCSIFIFDYMASVTVDDCVGCRIFLGPIKSSIFIRDCSGCKLMVACQQFRTRDCKQLDVFLCCATQPIIESSTGMKFACFQYYYPQLVEQFKSANLSVYNNNWSDIHDFTPVRDEENFGLLPLESNVNDFIPLSSATSADASLDQATTERSKSVIPQTLGKRRKIHDDSCLVVFFSNQQTKDRARQFIEKMTTEHVGCSLVQSKEFLLKPDEAQRVFASDVYNAAVSQGPVIGLEYNGNEICSTCRMVLGESRSLVFTSNNSESARKEIENFYNIAQMHLSI